jgi:hypothetical protein
MSTFEMNNNNNDETNEFWYDKNEFYAENGLAKGHKKDRKSHSKKALEQAEERQKKQDEHISKLPSKMQKLLLKENAIKAVKAFAKKDVAEKSVGKTHKKITNPVKNTSQNVVYDDTEYGSEEEYDYEDALRDEEYEAGLAMWQRYGLTKQQYDADLEHRENIAALDAFNEDPENYHAPPDYKKNLEEKIKKFEDEIEARQKAEEEALADVNWYNPDDFDLDDPFEDWSGLSYPVEDEEETLEDFAERMREQRMEYNIENARDDMRDDY